jgi:hypothetical protein
MTKVAGRSRLIELLKNIQAAEQIDRDIDAVAFHQLDALIEVFVE